MNKPTALLLTRTLTALAAAGTLRADEPTLGADYTVIFDHKTSIPMESGYIYSGAPSLA